jgi:transposase-like protein
MSALEKKYTVKQIAKIVGCSENTVRRRFRDDPKVGRLGSGETRYKRPHFQLFISESSFVAWWDELTKNGR